jgi:hypothetical protein
MPLCRPTALQVLSRKGALKTITVVVQCFAAPVGQLMTLRSDEPTMFFQRDRAAADLQGALGIIAGRIDSVRMLLWALLILAIIGIVQRWR